MSKSTQPTSNWDSRYFGSFGTNREDTAIYHDEVRPVGLRDGTRPGFVKGSRQDVRWNGTHDDVNFFSHRDSGTEGKDVHPEGPESSGLERIETDNRGHPIYSHQISHGGSLNADRIRRGREPV
jgi:hypothetical protein